MSEVIYVLMIAFVGYVIYTVMTDKNGTGVETHFNSTDAPVETVATEAVAAPAKPAPAPAAVAAEVVENTGDELKNPKTGEVSKIPNNYRFGKRWIKEALVAEGLLDKVYKNNEVNDAVSVKAQAAMAALKNMDKYRV